MVLSFHVEYAKMLSFFLVAEALTGLIYHRPPGENSRFHLPLRSRHSPEQDFLRSTCMLCLKAVFPHFLSCLYIWHSIGDEDSCTRHESSSPIRWQMKTRYGVFHWVSNSIHMKQTQQCDWKLGSWIINEFEKWTMNYDDIEKLFKSLWFEDILM